MPPGEQKLYEVVEAFADGRVPFAAPAGAYDDAVRGASNIPNPLTAFNAAQVAVATAELSDDGRAEARSTTSGGGSCASGDPGKWSVLDCNGRTLRGYYLGQANTGSAAPEVG